MDRQNLPTVAPAKWGLPFASDGVVERDESFLLAIAVVTVIAWQTTIGSQILFPFSLLATWFHEMGHGLTAALLGAQFERLVIYPDASGLAQYSGRLWGVGHAIVAAVGLMGPALAGSLLIMASRSRKLTRLFLTGLGAALIVSTLVWVRSLAGWIVLPGFAALALWGAYTQRERARRFVIELFGVQAAISVWHDLGYLFSPGGVVGGQLARSDTGAIADALILPYWFWGGAITAAILLILWRAFRFASTH